MNMSDQERLVRFKLLGQDYTFYTGASEEEMNEVLDLVRKMIEENVSGMPGTLPASRVAVMACLNLASKFMKLKRDFEEYKVETEGRINSINSQLEDLFFFEKKQS
jgi:cell division protein ZapA (FtsZ GTPase activity inhibitor)